MTATECKVVRNSTVLCSFEYVVYVESVLLTFLNLKLVVSTVASQREGPGVTKSAFLCGVCIVSQCICKIPHSPKTCGLVQLAPKFLLCVNGVNGCPSRERFPVQDGPCLAPEVGRDWLQLPPSPW